MIVASLFSVVVNAHLSALRSSKLARILTWRPRRQLFEEIVVKYAPAKWQAQTKEAERSRAARPPVIEKKSETELEVAKPVTFSVPETPSGPVVPSVNDKKEGESAEMKSAFVVESLIQRQRTERMLKVNEVFCHFTVPLPFQRHHCYSHTRPHSCLLPG